MANTKTQIERIRIAISEKGEKPKNELGGPSGGTRKARLHCLAFSVGYGMQGQKRPYLPLRWCFWSMQGQKRPFLPRDTLN